MAVAIGLYGWSCGNLVGHPIVGHPVLGHLAVDHTHNLEKMDDEGSYSAKTGVNCPMIEKMEITLPTPR